jgi:antitoxin component of RelBE/YafQ-DinJ toxin-antitoxin module
MRQSLKIDLDERLSAAATAKAAADDLSLPAYIEMLLQKDLGGEEAIPLIVFAPDNVRELELIRDKDETDEEFERRKNIINAVLDASGH